MTVATSTATPGGGGGKASGEVCLSPKVPLGAGRALGLRVAAQSLPAAGRGGNALVTWNHISHLPRARLIPAIPPACQSSCQVFKPRLLTASGLVYCCRGGSNFVTTQQDLPTTTSSLIAAARRLPPTARAALLKVPLGVRGAVAPQPSCHDAFCNSQLQVRGRVAAEQSHSSAARPRVWSLICDLCRWRTKGQQ